MSDVDYYALLRREEEARKRRRRDALMRDILDKTPRSLRGDVAFSLKLLTIPKLEEELKRVEGIAKRKQRRGGKRDEGGANTSTGARRGRKRPHPW